MSPEAQRIEEVAQLAAVRDKTEKRFFAKVQMCPEGSTCWKWRGYVGTNGYGQFWDGERLIQAHWFLLPKRPERGKEACHRCDNKRCVNPDHIFIGTRSDNMRDMVAKKRHNTAPGCKAMLAVRNVRGSKNSQSKLTEEQVLEIKSTPVIWGSGRALAKKFNVTESCISLIRRGINWA